MTAYALGLESRMQPKAMLLQQLMESMHAYHRQGVRTLLIIDEAQDLGAAALEELRLLTNLHHAGHPLLQIILVGQEPLRELVRQPEMEQLHQRLIAAWHLQPLDPEETIGYVRHRLETAGWQGDPVFEPGVMQAVYRFSQGVPRRINLICSRLLLHGCISERHRLTQADALDLVHELGEEELAPSAEGTSASEQPEVDWAAIDQGLEWTPREALVLTEEPEPEPELEPEPEPEARASSDEREVPEAAAETADAKVEAAESSALVRDRAWNQEQPNITLTTTQPETDRPDFGSRLEPMLSPLPGLAVENAGGGNGARVERAASKLAQAQALAQARAAELPRARPSPRIIRRRSAGILGFILFVLLSLVPAGILLLPMVAGLSASMPAAVPWSPPLLLS
jgi:hypothetical protein